MDGYIRVGTKVDEKGLDNGIKEIEKKIDVAEQQKLVVETDMKNTQQELSKVNSQLDNLKSKAEQLKSTFSGIQAGGTMNPQQFINMQTYNALLPDIQKAEKEQAKISNQLQKQQIQYQKINSQISNYKDKITQIDLRNQEKQIKSINTTIGGAVKKVARWSLALVGIRSAYAGIRSLVNQVSQYNEQVSTDLQYMGFALAKTFESFVKWIINALYKILGLVNQLFVALFGINLFKKSGVSAFQKAMDKSAKSAKKIKNSLASFDEMNILEDTSQKDSGAGATGGVGAPSFDLSKMQGEPPQWMLWLKDNLPLITALIGGVVAAVIALKMGLSGIQALGIGIMVAGIIKFVQDLIEFLKDPTWEKFGELLTDFGIIILGLGVLMKSWQIIVIAVIVAIVGFIITHWDEIKEYFSKFWYWFVNLMSSLQNFLVNIIVAIWNFVVSIFNKIQDVIMFFIKSIIENFKGAFNGIRSMLDGLFTGFKQIFNGILMIARGDFKNGFISIFKGIGNIVIGIMNGVIDGINGVLYPLRALISAASSITGANWSIEQVSIPHIPLMMAKGGILTKPTPVIAGEAGKEAFLPLENNTEWMDILANRIASVIGGGNRPINIILNGRTIQRQLLRMQEDDEFVRNT